MYKTRRQYQKKPSYRKSRRYRIQGGTPNKSSAEQIRRRAEQERRLAEARRLAEQGDRLAEEGRRLAQQGARLAEQGARLAQQAQERRGHYAQGNSNKADEP